jgi:penicillin-binding protein 1A
MGRTVLRTLKKVPRRVAVAAAVVLVVAGFLLVARPQDCPSISEFLRYDPPEASRVMAANGSKLADLSPERRVVVDMDRVPGVVSEGFVAVEDRRFWSHGGVDVRGIARAVWRNLRATSLEEGFSTITMQLARSTFAHELPRGKKLSRKFCEVRLATQIERRMEKREILQRYLNQVYMGSGLYGVEAAARGYFGKSATQLDLAESALLVGLVKNPEGYNPRRSAERARARRDVVLDVMLREGVIDSTAAAKAKSRRIRLVEPPNGSTTAPWVVAAVRAELRNRFGPDADTRGLIAYTAIEPRVQTAAQRALVAQIEAIEEGRFGRYRHKVPDSALAPAEGSGSPYLQGMALVLEAHTGNVVALVGGRDFPHSSYDRALTALRQPGSAFKPIVYAAALQQGMTLADRIDTSPVTILGANATWRPADALVDSAGVLGVRPALARSSNHAAVRAGQFAGVDHVIDLAKALGISTPIPPVPSVFLGAAEVNPAEFVAAYAAFANGGMRVTPRLVQRVEDARGTLVWEDTVESVRALDEATAFLTVSLLEEVVNRGTGTAVRSTFGETAAGKTGTTNDSKDVWFVGVTPDYAAGVWIGFDEPRTIVSNATGGRLAAPVWGRIMAAAYRDRPSPASWSRPDNVVTATIDAGTGKLSRGRCPRSDVREEFFIEGTEPREFCPLHGGSAIERFLGGLFRKLGRIL